MKSREGGRGLKRGRKRKQQTRVTRREREDVGGNGRTVGERDESEQKLMAPKPENAVMKLIAFFMLTFKIK